MLEDHFRGLAVVVVAKLPTDLVNKAGRGSKLARPLAILGILNLLIRVDDACNDVTEHDSILSCK